MVYINELVAYEPPRRLEMRSVEGPFAMRVVYEFDEAGANATLARIRTGGEGSTFYGLADPLLSLMVRRGVARDLRALQRALEAG